MGRIELQPRALHGSPVIPRAPNGFGRMKMSPDERECLERQALSVFATMSNSGHGFREALTAVYLTGLRDAYELAKPTTEREG